jgi:hypothetical protein
LWLLCSGFQTRAEGNIAPRAIRHQLIYFAVFRLGKMP